MENKKSTFNKIGSLIGDIIDAGGQPLEIIVSKETYDEEMAVVLANIPDEVRNEIGDQEGRMETDTSLEGRQVVTERESIPYTGGDLEIDGQMHRRQTTIITPSEELPKGQFIIKGYFEESTEQ